MFPTDFVRHEYLGNPVSAYCLAGAAFASAAGGFLILRRLATRVRPGPVSDLFGQVRAHELAIVALDLSVRALDLPRRFGRGLHVVAVLVVAYRFVVLLSTLARYSIHKTVLSGSSDRENYATAHAATMAVQGLIWLAVALFVLSNLGFNVTSMLAGLGIGGIAVALAAQAVLGDLFSAVAIYLDKPFVVGDSIKVADFSGTVEHIGIKTTRVRSLGGELLVYPNSTLTSARIQNFRRMEERRVVIHFAVPLGTSTETLRAIPQQAAAVVNKTPDARFGRAHLSQYQEFGLQFEVVFHVLSADYARYMDVRQAVLIGLLEALRADGVALAQPTMVMMPGAPV